MANGDAKRDTILTAAMEVFANYGFKKTTVGDIIRAAGVSRATVYKHFGDKDEIFDAVVEREIREMLAEDRRVLAGKTTTRERLKAVITVHADMIRTKVNVLRVTKERFAEIVPHTRERMEHMTAEATALFEDIIQQGVESGEIEVEDVRLTAIALLCAVKGVFMSAVMDAWDAERDVIIERMVDMLVDGLKPRGGAAA